eukprot:COSAG02_NODE_1931_length_10329_cov_7.963930_8_plen_87_part_00
MIVAEQRQGLLTNVVCAYIFVRLRHRRLFAAELVGGGISGSLLQTCCSGVSEGTAPTHEPCSLDLIMCLSDMIVASGYYYARVHLY